jgi:uncharacterized integral membrane protein
MDRSRKEQISQGLKEFGKLVIAPQFILFVLISVTTSLWLDSLVAFLIRTSLWLPGGWALYLITGMVGACIVGGIVLMFVRMAQMMPLGKEARACKKLVDSVGFEEIRERWRASALRIRPPMWTVLLAFSVMVPTCVATVLASDPPLFGVNEHGKIRYSTREEAIRRLATMIEREGLVRKR